MQFGFFCYYYYYYYLTHTVKEPLQSCSSAGSRPLRILSHASQVFSEPLHHLINNTRVKRH